MRRGLLIVIAIVLLLPVLVVVLAESPLARALLEQQISQRLDGRAVEIGDHDIDWGWSLTVHLEDVRVANPPWARHEQMAELDALAVTIDSAELLRGRIDIEHLRLQRPVLHLARRQDETSNWAGLTGAGEGGADATPDAITIEQGHLTYIDATSDTDLAADLRTVTDDDGRPQLAVEAAGRYLGRSLQVEARGGDPQRLVADDMGQYPLAMSGRFGETEFRYDGWVHDLRRLAALRGQLQLSGPDTSDLSALLGWPPPDLPAIDLQGQLVHEGARWGMKDLQAQLGDSQLTGSVVWEQGEIPRIEARLRGDRLDLNQLGILPANQTGEPPAQQSAEVGWERRWAQRLSPLREYQASLNLDFGQLDYGDQTLRDVQLRAQLGDGRLDVEHVHAAQGEARELTGRGWVDVQPETLRGEVRAQLEQVDLGQALAPLGFADLGTADGRLNAEISAQALVLRDTALRYQSPDRQLTLDLRADARELAGSAAPGVNLEGSGTRFGVPFKYDLALGPLLDLRRDQPYPVAGTIASRDTTVRLEGTITQPMALKSADLQVHAEGPNPARLNRLTGLNLPELPPYQARGRVRIDGDLIRVSNLEGQVGESDLAGDVRVRQGERVMAWVTLSSQRLDVDDLLPMFGMAPGTDGEKAAPEQRRLAEQQERQQTLFPDRPWHLEGLRSFDMRLRYQAANVNARYVPLTDVQFDLALDNGVLTVKPLQIGLGGGEVAGQLRVDATEAPMQGALALDISQVNVKPLLFRADLPEIAKDSAGVIGGKVDLRFHGRSLDGVMGNLNGTLELAMSGGRLDVVAVEALGLDLGEALMAALADSDSVPVRCAYARFDANDGRVAMEQFFADTDDANFTGGGTINLDAERLELAFEGHPKDASVFTASSPVKLEGPLMSPSIGVASGELLARGALSVLGAIVAPPLAILPWVEPGRGEKVGPGCQQVLAEYHSDQRDEG